LFYDFNPKMEYPRITSRARSKYCVGFVCKYLDTYVIRVFSRNDIYKKGTRGNVTVLQSDTTEVFRALSINGIIYHFKKGLSHAGGYITHTKTSNVWSPRGEYLTLNEVVRHCDCKYLNDYISEKDIDCFPYIYLFFPALTDNKVEIVFKHKLFSASYSIKSITKYLKNFTPKQIQFVCENKVLNTLPFIKKHGIYDIGLLKKLEQIMGKRYHISIYELLPSAKKYNNKTRLIISFLIGGIFMLINHLIFN